MNVIYGIFAFVFIGLLIWLFYEIAIAIYKKTALRYETMSDVAKVVGKNYYDNAAVQIATKQYPRGLYFVYNVYVLYSGKKYCIDNKDLYEKAEVGDIVHILIHKGYNKKGELKHTYLSIED